MLYIFVFNNGQVMLVDLVMPAEPYSMTESVRDKMLKARTWSEARYSDQLSALGVKSEMPDWFHQTTSGAVIDCSQLMSFGPYVEPPPAKEFSLGKLEQSIKGMLRYSFHDIGGDFKQLTSDEQACFIGGQREFDELRKWLGVA